MRILSKEEATKVERSKRDPWKWPDAVCAAASNSFSVLPVIGARTPDGDPLALGVTVRILETLYDQGYIIAKLEDHEKGALDSMLQVADDLAHELCMQGSTHPSLDAYRLMIRTLPSEVAFAPERIEGIQRRMADERAGRRA